MGSKPAAPRSAAAPLSARRGLTSLLVGCVCVYMIFEILSDCHRYRPCKDLTTSFVARGERAGGAVGVEGERKTFDIGDVRQREGRAGKVTFCFRRATAHITGLSIRRLERTLGSTRYGGYVGCSSQEGDLGAVIPQPLARG